MFAIIHTTVVRIFWKIAGSVRGKDGEALINDLISRAAAIDAIVSATAFPDAEYIKNLCQNPANSEDWLGGVCDAINAVEDVNTVDAVPVEWMRDKMRGYASALKSTELKALVTVMQMWQKEQEAQDG